MKLSQTYLLFVVALAGLAVSGYLLWAYISGGPITCGEEGGCEVVRASAYAKLLGVPTPWHGVVFYALLGFGAVFRLKGPLKALTLVGLLVSAWLTYLEMFVIEAWCRWCVVSAALTLVAFLVVWIYPKNHGDQQ